MRPGASATCVLGYLLICSTTVPAQPAGELIERTLAIVAGQAVTLSDVRTALALGLIEPSSTTDPVGEAAGKLVERMLVLREVQRYAPPDPDDALVEERLATLRQRFSDPEQFAGTLQAGAFTIERLRAWIRDDIRIASYLSQRFAAAGMPGEDEVSAFYSTRRDEFERAGLSFEQAIPQIRERLSAERRTELIRDWTADLRRRANVIELWRKE